LDENFVQDIADEENAGDEERANHAIPVSDFPFGLDENKPRREEEGGDAVEGGVEGGEVRDAHCGVFRLSSRRQVSAIYQTRPVTMARTTASIPTTPQERAMPAVTV
jgi:hypothetical protein